MSLQHRRDHGGHEDEVAGAAGQREDVPEVVGTELPRPEVGAICREDDGAD